MTFRDLCDVVVSGNVMRVSDMEFNDLAYGLVTEIKRDRWYLMDKEVLGVSFIDSSRNRYSNESYVMVMLHTREKENEG